MIKKILYLSLFFINLLHAEAVKESPYNKKDMLIISTTMGKSPQISKAYALIREAQKYHLEIDFMFDSQIDKSKYTETINQYKVVMFDSLAGASSINSLMEQFAEAISKSNQETTIVPISIKSESPYRRNITLEENIKLNTYWHNGGKTNFKNFAKFIRKTIFHEKITDIDDAVVIPKKGIYHPKNPNVVFADQSEFARFFGIDLNTTSKPIIAIGMHRGSVVSGSLAHIDSLIAYIESKGIQTMPYFTEVSGDDFIGAEFLTYGGKTIVDVVINFQIMIIDHESLKKKYQKLNVPILHALYYSKGDIKAWRADNSGVDFPMIPMSYIIPETIGWTDSMMVAAQNPRTKTLEPIPEQIKSIGNKAINISRLKRIKNADKKVAIMYYNYPSGVDNMGASFMNIPESLELTLKQMKAHGYDTQELNASLLRKKATAGLKAMYSVNLDEQARKMLSEDSADLYPYEDYIKEFYKLPVETRTDMIKFWGYPLESKMLIYKEGKWYFLVPRFKVGNIMIMPQPRRAEREDSIWAMNKDINRDDATLWHSPTVALGHAYLAGYLYVRKQFKADAIVHFGTHGTQEWSPGKERGLSVGDGALSVLGDTPVVYPYITNNLAEAIQAKRRGRATLISHQTPPFGLTGTYKELSEIMDFIHQYKSSDDGMLKTQLKKQITQVTVKMNIHKDIEYSQESIEKDFEKYISKVEDYVLGASKQAMPLGMHTFGTYPKEEHLISTVMQMLGSDFIAKVEGDDKYFAKNYQEFNNSKTYKLMKDYVIDEKDLKRVKDEEIRAYLEQGLQYKYSFINTKEISNFLRALDGEYIEGGVGGDSIRNPDSLPTGVNMYGFDPSKVPTKAAYKTGSKLMKDFIENYYKEHGKYPKKLTFNLWSLETMRHYGVLESQIMYAMGVRPVWNETGISNKFIQNIVKQKLQNFLPGSVAKWLAELVTVSRISFLLSLTPDSWLKKAKKMLRHAYATNKGKVQEVEIIPFSELKRPRVDVVISATGLYRDTFPQVMELLANAVKTISELKEKNNYLRESSLALEKRLAKNKDINASEAKYLSTIRIFSNKTGDYGSGGTEGIIFSRTSNLYGLLTSDDPFSYFGSIAMAVRNIDGKSPKTYIANLRDPNDAKIESTAKFLSKELRGRYFHPKWIKEMKAEGYSGTLAVQDVMANFWGWQVVDPDVVRDDQWQEFVEIYVDDKYDLDIQEWFKSLNPDAYARMIKKMLEANRKGYFKTDENTLKKLVELYKELETNYSITKTYNEKLKEFVDDKAIGFGLMTPSGKMINKVMPEVPKPKKAVAKPEPKVKGQKLDKIEKQKIEHDYKDYVALAILLFIVFGGMFYEFRRKES